LDCSFLAPAELCFRRAASSPAAAAEIGIIRLYRLIGGTGFRKALRSSGCGKAGADKLVLFFSLSPGNVFQKGLHVSLFCAAGLVSTRPSSAEIRIRVFAEVRECSVPFFRGAEIGLAGR